MARPYRLVLDTNVIVRAFVNLQSHSGRILRGCERRQVIPLLSRSVLGEYRAVLRRSEIVQRYPQLKRPEIEVSLERLMEEIESKYRVDPDREYLTGLSLGGYGTWDTAIAFPNRWAAIASIAGAGDPNDVARIKDIPCWIFHGAKDPIIPVDEARRMYCALVKIGGRAKLTIELQAGHNSWNQPYHDPAFFAWLMQQRKSAPAQPPAMGPATYP